MAIKLSVVLTVVVLVLVMIAGIIVINIRRRTKRSTSHWVVFRESCVTNKKVSPAVWRTSVYNVPFLMLDLHGRRNTTCQSYVSWKDNLCDYVDSISICHSCILYEVQRKAQVVLSVYYVDVCIVQRWSAGHLLRIQFHNLYTDTDSDLWLFLTEDVEIRFHAPCLLSANFLQWSSKHVLYVGFLLLTCFSIALSNKVLE